MIPIPNVLAGIFIGIANDAWLSRLIIPFGWGIIFCIYRSFTAQNEKNHFIAKGQEIHGKKSKWGMSHSQSFYFVEYMTATSTSLVFSAIAGMVKGLL